MDNWRECVTILCKYTEFVRTAMGDFDDLHSLLDMQPLMITAIDCIVPRANMHDLQKLQAMLPIVHANISEANLLIPDTCAASNKDTINILNCLCPHVHQTTDDICTHLISRVKALMADYTRLVIIRATTAIMADIANMPPRPVDEVYDTITEDPMVAELQQFIAMAQQYSYFAAMDDDTYLLYAAAMVAVANYILSPDADYNTMSAAICRLRDIHCPLATKPAYVDRDDEWCQEQMYIATLMETQLYTTQSVYMLSNACMFAKRPREDDRCIGRRPRGHTRY